MITAIDTNVLLDMLMPDEKFFEFSVKALEDTATSVARWSCALGKRRRCTPLRVAA
jgi:hypothetical protein